MSIRSRIKHDFLNEYLLIRKYLKFLYNLVEESAMENVTRLTRVT